MSRTELLDRAANVRRRLVSLKPAALGREEQPFPSLVSVARELAVSRLDQFDLRVGTSPRSLYALAASSLLVIAGTVCLLVLLVRVDGAGVSTSAIYGVGFVFSMAAVMFGMRWFAGVCSPGTFTSIGNVMLRVERVLRVFALTCSLTLSVGATAFFFAMLVVEPGLVSEHAPFVLLIISLHVLAVVFALLAGISTPAVATVRHRSNAAPLLNRARAAWYVAAFCLVATTTVVISSIAEGTVAPIAVVIAIATFLLVKFDSHRRELNKATRMLIEGLGVLYAAASTSAKRKSQRSTLVNALLKVQELSADEAAPMMTYFAPHQVMDRELQLVVRYLVLRFTYTPAPSSLRGRELFFDRRYGRASTSELVRLASEFAWALRADLLGEPRKARDRKSDRVGSSIG